MRKKYKITLSIIVILLILILSILLYFKFGYKKGSNGNPTKTSNVVEAIDAFGYTLDDRDSKLMKDEFNNLKKILSESEINYDEYAKSLAKLFVIDLYSIDNKVNKYDVGSLEYIFETEQEKFKTKVMDTIYELVEDDSFDNRKQELPEVESINVIDSKVEEYELNDSKIDAYVIKLEWTYVKDLGYDKSATVYVVKQDNKLYVIEFNPE